MLLFDRKEIMLVASQFLLLDKRYNSLVQTSLYKDFYEDQQSYNIVKNKGASVPPVFSTKNIFYSHYSANGTQNRFFASVAIRK